MNNLKIFENAEFGQIRTVVVRNEPWFCLPDICRALEIGNASQVKTRLNADGVISNEVIDSVGRRQNANFVNEANLYKAIFQSKKDSAERFTDWVTSEVLPSIRKTGFYEMPKAEKDDRTEIMMMNARTRMAQTYLKLAQVDTLSSTYKTILVAKASEVLAGEQLLPLPKSERKVYSAKEIGDMLGITANKVGRVANKHNLKTDEFGEYRRSKSEHSAKEVDTWVYFDTAISAIEEILEAEGEEVT